MQGIVSNQRCQRHVLAGVHGLHCACRDGQFEMQLGVQCSLVAPSYRLSAPSSAMQAIAFFMSPRSYIRLACMTFLASVLAAYWAVFIPKVYSVMR